MKLIKLTYKGRPYYLNPAYVKAVVLRADDATVIIMGDTEESAFVADQSIEEVLALFGL